MEIEVIKALQKGQMVTDVSSLIRVDIDRFYGIEYEEFPAQIAQVAMWLIDHQMNMRVSETFGDYFVRLPIRKSAVIVQENSLKVDWQSLLYPESSIDVVARHANIYIEEPEATYKTVNVRANTYSIHHEMTLVGSENVRFDFIIGNPPFIGKQHQNPEQKADMDRIWSGVSGSGVMDYVTCWYIRAAQYLNVHSGMNIETNEYRTRVAFVSTNSIAQGEQVGILWNELFNKYKIKIHFAHRTFSWTNEARGKAAVHVVIIGFANFDVPLKYLYEYETSGSEPQERIVKNINPYLVEANDLIIVKRKSPICNVPQISFGSMPNDGGHLLLTDEDKQELLHKDPGAGKFIKPLISSREYLTGINRWCLWLTNIQPDELSRLPEIAKRVRLVKEIRSKSTREMTRRLAAFPTLFGEDRQPESNYILIPRVSSENRKYIPLGFFSPDFIVGDTCLSVTNGSLLHFGVLMSEMHMSWIRNVCGRLKSDYRYSNEIVYNNYLWPVNPTEKQ